MDNYFISYYRLMKILRPMGTSPCSYGIMLQKRKRKKMKPRDKGRK